MTIKVWLDSAVRDAERRGLPALKPLLETLARATSALRAADWNGDATGEFEDAPRAESGPVRRRAGGEGDVADGR
jgi:hypothetical protein